MNKWFAGLVICGLACGMAACSDSDDDGNCLKEEPALVQESAKLEAAVKADGVTFIKEADPNDATKQLDVASDCEKYATNLSNYLAEGDNSANMIEAVKSYPKFGGSLVGVLCGLIDTNKIIQAAAKVKLVWDVGQNCIVVHKDDLNAEAQGKINTSLTTFQSVDGWNNVLSAAAQAAVENDQNKQ